jgi:N-6 DNA Methylase
MTSLSAAASQIAAELGPPFTARSRYAYTVPSEGGAAVRVLDAGIFSSPSPSLNSAYLAVSESGPDREQQLSEIGYFGAPFALIRSNNTFDAFRYRAPLVAEPIESFSVGHASDWIRGTTSSGGAMAQLSLLAESRELILAETTRALATVVSELMSSLIARVRVDHQTAFQLALRSIRAAVFGENGGIRSTQGDLVDPAVLSFSHIPLEAVAELYETLALTPETRKGLGVVYTPAWIADALVARLPASAFTAGPAIDPTCGSGTFLVAYLERLVEEHARRMEKTRPRGADLREAVKGLDLDPVALESTRLTLDLFAHRLGIKPLNWQLRQADATSDSELAETLIGNLPFGHRTFQGRSDLSWAILEHWLLAVPTLKHLAVLLPDSFAYATNAAPARAAVREQFRLEEAIELPEEAFERTSAPTLGIVATRGTDTASVLVRRVGRRALRSFRLTGVSSSFTAQLPPSPKDPWVFSPFYRELTQAEVRAGDVLGGVADMRLGLQAYGAPRGTIGPNRERGPRVLDEPRIFATWRSGDWKQLPRLAGTVEELRRPGPVELYPQPKILIRTTTNPRQQGRLAAIVDTHGLWFTDKFVGIWLEGEPVTLRAMAAYFQTRFAELWFATNNPSRKVRLATLRRLPIPNLPGEWWERAATLVPENQVVLSPRWRHDRQASLLDEEFSAAPAQSGWAWFEQAVEAALGITPSSAPRMEDYLREHLDVSGLAAR